MKLLLTTVVLGGLLAAPMAANAQYLGIGPRLAPAPESIRVPGEAVRIQVVDPAAAAVQLNSAAESGQLEQVQSEAASDPAVSAELASMRLPISNVFAVATDINGVTTVYVMG